MEGALMWCGCH